MKHCILVKDSILSIITQLLLRQYNSSPDLKTAKGGVIFILRQMVQMLTSVMCAS